MISGRGCYGRCDFCGASGLLRRNYSAKYCVDLMELVIDRYSPEILEFQESLTLSTKKWVKGFCEEIISRKLNILYSVWSRGDFNYDDETLSLLAESGCYIAHVGFESGNNSVLKNMTKKITIDKYYKLVNDYRRHGINLGGSFILNMPGESEESLYDTVDFIDRSKVAFSFGFAFPYPGTKLYDYVRENSFGDSIEKMIFTKKNEYSYIN